MRLTRPLSRWVAVSAFVVAGVAALAGAQQAAPAGAVTGVGNFSHIVSSLEPSIRFYREVLGLDVDGAPRLFSPWVTSAPSSSRISIRPCQWRAREWSGVSP